MYAESSYAERHRLSCARAFSCLPVSPDWGYVWLEIVSGLTEAARSNLCRQRKSSILPWARGSIKLFQCIYSHLDWARQSWFDLIDRTVVTKGLVVVKDDLTPCRSHGRERITSRYS